LAIASARWRDCSRLWEKVGIRVLYGPRAIMIAVARSGNNNLCHIVTPDHGKRAVPRLLLHQDRKLASERAQASGKAAGSSDPSHF
jgi:hypothetical protein